MISDALAGELLADLASRAPEPPLIPAQTPSKAARFSFFQVVVVFAAICFSAAIALFISANWDVIPRLVKVAGIFAVMAGGLVGGAIAGQRQSRHSARIEEALYLLGGAAYVAGIALVGQMYHIPGELHTAMLTFAIGLGAAGLLVRSQVLIAGALGALVWWYVGGDTPENPLRWQFPVVLAGCVAGWAFGHLRQSKWIRRLAVLAFLVCLSPFVVDVYTAIPEPVRAVFWLVVFGLALAGLALERYRPEQLRALPLLAKPRVLAFFFVMLAALLALHILFERGDALALPAAMGIIASLAVLFVHGRDKPRMRYACYALFGLEVTLLYMVTLSTLLSTSGFFFAAGLLLSVLALVIWRFEKRFAQTEAAS